MVNGLGNGYSGKSNLVEAIGLLRSTPAKLTAPIRGPGGGGVKEWIWKGGNNGHATIEAIVDYPGLQPILHRFEFTETASRFELINEVIEDRQPGATQSVADGWVVAYATASDLTGVTHEEFGPDVKKKVPIPN